METYWNLSQIDPNLFKSILNPSEHIQTYHKYITKVFYAHPNLVKHNQNYPILSKLIHTYQNLSKPVKTYPKPITNMFKLIPNLSKHVKTYPNMS